MSRSQISGVSRSIWARLLVGLALLGVLAALSAATVDVDAVVTSLRRADLRIVLVQLPLLMLLVWILRAIRWHAILAALGARPRFIDTYLTTAVSLGLAVVTPMQSGEVLKLAHGEHRAAVPTGAALGGFAFERLADAVVVIGLTVAAAYTRLVSSGEMVHTAVMALLAIAAAVAGAIALVRRFAPGQMAAFVRGAKVLLTRPALHAAVWGTTILCWLVTIQVWQLCLFSVGIDAPLALSALIVGTVTLAAVAALVPGALGVSELTAASLFMQQGLTAEDALTGALALRLTWLVAVGLGALHWALWTIRSLWR